MKLNMWRHALAAIATLGIVGAANAVVTLPTSNYAGDQDGSSRYFGLLGLYGIAGDFEVDVNSLHQLLTSSAESGAWNVNQTLSTPGYEAITDGTNGPAAVKAASTAAVAADKGVVVSISPNGQDPCAYGTKVNLPVSTNATALTQIIAASGSTKIYICSIALIAGGASAFNLNTGTGTNCGTSTAALVGSTTAANGMSFAANGGLTLGNGVGTVAVTAASSELCTLQSNAVYVSGNITYVQQ